MKSFSASARDAALFFGRDREQELIVANLLASRLTLLYGQSGIGKSSILCAGVVNSLRGPAPGTGMGSDFAVVYASEWHSNPEAMILGQVREEARRLTGEELEPAEAGAGFDQRLEWWTHRLDTRLLLILDQFEQYFLHHPPAQAHGFDRGLAQAIVRADLRVHCLISLREDSLVGLDRFKGEIPNLFRNRLRLDGLTEESALEAIRRPVDRYNEDCSPERSPVELEAGLAEMVVGELQDLVSPLARGRGVPGAWERPHENGQRSIEPAHLQLVMEALWAWDTQARSSVIRVATLAALGGCEEIVRTHVEAGLSGLPAKQRAIAARAIRYLITPSGTKVAHTAGDLADYADAPRERVAEMLERLCELRIMRPLPPAEDSQERRYEVFHDLLAEPMLEWRSYFEAQRLGSRMRWLLAALSAAIAAALAIAAYSTQPAPLRRLELNSIDTRFAVRGTIPPDRDIVIVYVDKRTLKALHHSKPEKTLRPYYAKLIDRLLVGKPKVIADDLEFEGAGHEGALLDAIGHAHGRIVLVSELFDSEGDALLFGEEGEEGATELLSEYKATAAYGGFPLDPGAVYRRMRYTAPVCEEYTAHKCPRKPKPHLPAFSVAVAEIAEDRRIPRFTSQTLVDYHGPPHTFASVSMIDVLRGRIHPSLFAGKIVVIGALGGSDIHRTPFTSAATMPGPEIQANAISSVRHGSALRAAGSGLASLLILALSLTALLVASVRWWVALAIFAMVAGAYLLLAQLFFDGGTYLPLVYPLLALALAGVGTLLARVYLAHQLRSRQGARAVPLTPRTA